MSILLIIPLINLIVFLLVIEFIAPKKRRRHQ